MKIRGHNVSLRSLIMCALGIIIVLLMASYSNVDNNTYNKENVTISQLRVIELLAISLLEKQPRDNSRFSLASVKTYDQFIQLAPPGHFTTQELQWLQTDGWNEAFILESSLTGEYIVIEIRSKHSSKLSRRPLGIQIKYSQKKDNYEFQIDRLW